MDTASTLRRFVRLAYSAELAAALAYGGHARSLARGRERIREIGDEELEHRANLARMMTALGIRPSRWLELKYRCIGTAIGWSCFVLGRFLPMYFAGRLESGNVNEYLAMRALAEGSPIAHELACIDAMARVEKEHELHFLAEVAGHRLLPLMMRLFGWGPGVSFNPLVLPARPAA